jgi:hypothetical protein
MTYLVRYWPYNKEIPEGWAFCRHLEGHHGFYSILIIKEESNEDTSDA